MQVATIKEVITKMSWEDYYQLTVNGLLNISIEELMEILENNEEAHHD